MTFSGGILKWHNLDTETEGEVEEVFVHREKGPVEEIWSCRCESKSGLRAHVTFNVEAAQAFRSSVFMSRRHRHFSAPLVAGIYCCPVPFSCYKLLTWRPQWSQKHGVNMFCIRWNRIHRLDICCDETTDSSWIALLSGSVPKRGRGPLPFI